MKGLRNIPRILKINAIEGYKLSLLFNNGESRIVDLASFLTEILNIRPGKLGSELLQNPQLFSQVEIIGTTIGWRDIGKTITDFAGDKQFFPYSMDPLMLYEHSRLDDKRSIHVGMKIKAARLEAGLTQEQLAQKSGTSKHYISRLENEKSDIELLTLKKIVEAGLGRKLSIQIF